MDICFLPPGFSIKDNGSTDIFSHISWYMYLRIFLRYMLEVELLGYKLYSYLPFPWHVSGHGVFQVLVRGVSHPRPLQVRFLHALSITWHFQIFKFGSYLRYCFQTFFVLLSPLILMFSYWHYLKTYFLALKKLRFSIACFWKMFSPRPSNFSLLSDMAIAEIIPCIWFLISTVVFSYVVFSLGSFLTMLCSCFTMLLASLLSFTISIMPICLSWVGLLWASGYGWRELLTLASSWQVVVLVRTLGLQALIFWGRAGAASHDVLPLN